MRVWKYFAVIFAVFAILWFGCAVAIVSYLDRNNGNIADTNSDASRFVYGLNGTDAAIYGRAPLMKGGENIIIIGSSNTRLAFSPRELSAALNGIPVHNMATSGGTVRNFEEFVRLSYQAIPKDDWVKTTFVVGLWYGAFVPPKKDCLYVPGHSSSGPVRMQVCNFPAQQVIRNEATRYGFFHFGKNGFGITPDIPRYLMRPALTLITPVILFNRLWGQAASNAVIWKHGLTGLLHDKILHTNAERNVAKLSPDEKYNFIQKRLAFGDISSEEFSNLNNLAQMISRHGSRLILVDLPLPGWHTSAVPFYADYQKRKQSYLKALVRDDHVTVVNLQGKLPDDAFFDGVHPRPKEIPLLTKFLANKIQPVFSVRNEDHVSAEFVKNKKRLK